MRVIVSFANGDRWVMAFKDAKVSTTVDESLFKIGTN
jgi:hypothetical protein